MQPSACLDASLFRQDYFRFLRLLAKMLAVIIGNVGKARKILQDFSIPWAENQEKSSNEDNAKSWPLSTHAQKCYACIFVSGTSK